MRLIDADELKIIPYSAFDVMPVCDISSAPTVEAIPIEWVEKYMAEELTTGSIMWQCLKEFVEDWEKENEM